MPADRQPPPHAEATLLPWYLNGTLTAEEARLVESHGALCPTCAAGLASPQTVPSRIGMCAQG